MSEPKRLSIDELEALLKREDSWDDQPLYRILPNGDIIQEDGRPVEKGKRPITFKEDLGGEYSAQHHGNTHRSCAVACSDSNT